MTDLRPQRGFTLIEAMLVVAIVGILSSVAAPSFQKSVLRTKVAERRTVMVRIKQAIQDHFIRNDSVVPGGGVIDSGWNPALPPGPQRRPMSSSMAVWNTYFLSSVQDDIMGGVYYSYRFVLTEAGGSSTIVILAQGDLDGDSLLSTKRLDFARTSSVYQLTAEAPPQGQEDDAGPLGTF